jgi:hypothetical protein
MRAAETLVSGLALPAPLALLCLVLCVLVWLDGGGYIVEAACEPANQRKTPKNRSSIRHSS